MDITQWLTKMQNKLGRASFMVIPLEEQMAYMNRFPEPKDDLARGYYQYRCQAMLGGKKSNVVACIGGFPVSLLLMAKCVFASKPEKAETAPGSAVFFRDGKPANIMPQELRQEFAECITDPIEGFLLRPKDLKLIWKLIFRYPLAWQFTLKCIVKIARYRYAMEKYGVRTLVVCNEYSYTSSVLTEFCSRNQVELINVMHGEKMLYARDTFFRFHRCYAWDEHYVKIFRTLRAEPTQFRVAIPDSIRFRVDEVPEKCYDYTIYLGDEGRAALTKIHESLSALKAKGAVVNIRPHPRYTNRALLEEICGDMPIEDPKKETIEMSVLKSRAVVSQFSTVLLQAYCNGIPVVIDDITNPEHFAKLEERQYIMLNAEHKLLSSLVRAEVVTPSK